MVKIEKFVTKNNLKHNLGSLKDGKAGEKEITGLKVKNDWKRKSKTT